MNRGSVLVLSLWVMSVLTTLTVTQADTVLSAWRLAQRHQDRFDALALAQDGVTQALAEMEADATRTWDAPSEPWGRRQTQTTRPGTWTTRMTDEGSRLNMNTASVGALARLPESSLALAQTLVAQRTRRPFHHVAELALVPGATLRQLQAWAPLITVVGQGPRNLNSVSASVLELLGIPPDAAAVFVAWRNGPDGELGTADDHVFSDVADVAPAISALLKPQDAAVLLYLVQSDRLGVRSNAFRVVAQGVSAGRDHPSRTLTVLVERQAPGAPAQIRGWHED